MNSAALLPQRAEPDSISHCDGEPPSHYKSLRALPLFEDLPDEALAPLHAQIRELPIQARRRISLAREMHSRIGFAWSGRYRVLAQGPRGQQVVLYSISPKQAFGIAPAILDATCGLDLRLVADEPGLLLFLPAQALFSAAAASAQLSNKLYRHLAECASAQANRYYELAAFDAQTRLQAELIRLAQGAIFEDGALILRNAPTHAEIAAQVCVTREVVSRHLGVLTRAGLIRSSYRTIEYIDLDRLMRNAGVPPNSVRGRNGASYSGAPL